MVINLAGNLGKELAENWREILKFGEEFAKKLAGNFKIWREN